MHTKTNLALLSLALSAVSLQAQTILDVSGTYNGSTGISTAASFDGTQSAITETAANLGINTQADYGFTFWFSSTQTNDQALIGFDNGTDDYGMWMDQMSNSTSGTNWAPQLYSNITEAPLNARSSDIVTNDGSLHQVAYIYDYDTGSSDGIGSLYIDGGLIQSNSSAWAFTIAGGTFSVFDAGGKNELDGSMTDVAFYDSSNPLTAAVVTDLFNQGVGSLTVIPEPGTFALLGGLLALGSVMLRRRRA